jgi:hypothetical protein
MPCIDGLVQVDSLIFYLGVVDEKILTVEAPVTAQNLLNTITLLVLNPQSEAGSFQS